LHKKKEVSFTENLLTFLLEFEKFLGRQDKTTDIYQSLILERRIPEGLKVITLLGDRISSSPV
jgi:hypothetical protein